MTYSTKQILLIILILIIVIFVIYTFSTLQIVRYTKLKTPNFNILAKNYKNKHKIVDKYDNKIVVTMTTIPDRIDYIGPTIASILDQNIRVDEIALNIPYISRKGIEYKIPTWLLELSQYDFIKIHRIDKDYGPASKVLPTLKREINGTKIIVIDDDVIYHSNTINKLIRTFNKKNNLIHIEDQQTPIENVGLYAVTNFGIKLQANGTLPYITSRVNSFFTTSREVDLLQGFSAFIITPEMFPEHVYNLDNGPPEAISVDDIWLSGWLRKNNIKIITSPNTYNSLPLVNLGKMRQTTSLGSGENKGFTTDQIVINWFINKQNLLPVILNKK